MRETNGTAVVETGSAPDAQALRVLYGTGPGDVIRTFEHWSAGRDDPSQVSITYSAQFFDACRAAGARGHAVVFRREDDRRRLERGPFTIKHHYDRLRFLGGSASYHLGQAWNAMRLWSAAVRSRADVAVVAGVTHWFLLAPLAWCGVRVVPTLHCAFWPAGHRPRGRVSQLVQRLDGWFWRRWATATLCVSPECERQVREVMRGRPPRGPFVQVRAQYRPGALEAIAAPVHARPLRVVFAGRLEPNKGVFDLLDVIGRLERSRPGHFLLEFCGGGSAERDLREQVTRRALDGAVRVLGQLEAPAMREAYERAHVVVVPTTPDFAEGLNKVTVEAVLAGRPVIASRLSHAKDVLGEALIETDARDVGGYQAALERLADDPSAYARACAACADARAPFYDAEQGWGTALTRILDGLAREKGLKTAPPPS